MEKNLIAISEQELENLKNENEQFKRLINKVSILLHIDGKGTKLKASKLIDKFLADQKEQVVEGQVQAELVDNEFVLEKEV